MWFVNDVWVSSRKDKEETKRPIFTNILVLITWINSFELQKLSRNGSSSTIEDLFLL